MNGMPHLGGFSTGLRGEVFWGAVFWVRVLIAAPRYQMGPLPAGLGSELADRTILLGAYQQAHSLPTSGEPCDASVASK